MRALHRLVPGEDGQPQQQEVPGRGVMRPEGKSLSTLDGYVALER